MSTQEEMVEGFSELEEQLTVSKAEEKSRESYLGTVGMAKIIGVDPNPNDGFVVFTLNLPNCNTGKIGFSESEHEDGVVEVFLNNVHSTISDMTDAAYHSVPVTYTQKRWWVLLFGEEEWQLETTYSATGSKWYDIDERNGRIFMSRFQQLVFLAPMLLILLGYFGFGLNGIATIFGVLVSLVSWHVAYMVSGMYDPKQKSVKVETE